MRIFIGLEFEDDVKNCLYGAVLKIKENSFRCNITSKNNIHLTLRFLGECNQLEDIKKAITNTSKNITKFDLIIEGIGAFGKGNNIVWARIRRNINLYKMYEALSNELEEIGLPREDRSYSPHITLAREVRLGADLTGYNYSPLEVTVTKITLFESKRINGELTYLPLFRHNLEN